MDRIKIIVPGTFTAMDGREITFTEDDLRAAAEAYDYASDPAPFVVGHPKANHPAWGWASSLAYEDGALFAQPDPEKLDGDFADAVNAGRYAKISGSFYLPGDKRSPKPDGLYLQHVGFLGGAAPAVKGLGTVSLSEEAEGVVTIITAQEKQVDKPKTEAGDQSAAFAEREAELARREADADARLQAAEEREKSANATVASALHASNVAFAEQQIAAGKLAPAGKDRVIGLLDQLEPTATVQFGEASGEMTPVAAFKSLFEGAKPVVHFGEVAAPDGSEAVAEDPADIATRAASFVEAQRQAGNNISIAAGVRHVMKGE